MQLTGKIALVLGASRPVGRAIARVLAAQGVYLALPWLDWPESVEEMEKEFCHGSPDHLSLEVDLRKAAEVARLMTAIEKKWGGLDIVINNIERGGMPIVHGAYHRDINQDQWHLEMETTLHAKWLVFEQALPLLRQRQEGVVINISSIAGLTGRSGSAGMLFNDGYAAANRGVSSLTETWARRAAPTVRVNEIMLGLIDGRHGPGTRGWALLSNEQQEALIAHTLLKRTGTPEEVAKATLFLLRDADFVSGALLRVDGGYMLGGEGIPEMPKGIL